MNDLEKMIFTKKGIKAIQLGDYNFDEIVKIAECNNLTIAEHDIGFGSKWWLMTGDYEQYTKLCHKITVENMVINHAKQRL